MCKSSLDTGSGHLQTGSVRARHIGVRFRLHAGGHRRGALLLRVQTVEKAHQPSSLPSDHRLHLDSRSSTHIALDSRFQAARRSQWYGRKLIAFDLFYNLLPSRLHSLRKNKDELGEFNNYRYSSAILRSPQISRLNSNFNYSELKRRHPITLNDGRT